MKKLLDLLPVRQPVIRGKGVNEIAGIRYQLEYEVIHMAGEDLTELEATLARNLDPVAENPGVYDVDIERVQPFFEILLGRLGNPAARLTRDDDGSHQIKNTFLVFLLNPDKRRIRPQDGEQFRYRYMMQGGSGRAQSWVGASEFCVVDLSAGPATTGSLPGATFERDEAGATFSQRSLPNLARLVAGATTEDEVLMNLKRADHLLLLDMVRTVQSATAQVFLPNIGFETNIQAEKIIIPILVFRNHDLVNPLAAARPEDPLYQDFMIDMGVLEAEVRKMLLPKQKVVFIKGVHFLHDHKTISLALQKATKSKAGWLSTDLQQEKLQYVDAEALFHELGHSDDLLAASLMGTSPDSSDFVLGPTAGEQDFDSLSNLGDFDPAFLGDLKRRVAASRARGTRVLPVYVFSLMGKGEDLLLDGNSLVHATMNAVAVLQTNVSRVITPYFQDEDRVVADARGATRHILQGLASSLGGLESPLVRVTGEQQEAREDFAWILGYHPFGPFSSATSLSTALTGSVIRNHIISRIHVAFDLVQEAQWEIDHFLSNYIEASTNSNLETYLKSVVMEGALM